MAKRIHWTDALMLSLDAVDPDLIELDLSGIDGTRDGVVSDIWMMDTVPVSAGDLCGVPVALDPDPTMEYGFIVLPRAR
jgi:hypothetical protein